MEPPTARQIIDSATGRIANELLILGDFSDSIANGCYSEIQAVDDTVHNLSRALLELNEDGVRQVLEQDENLRPVLDLTRISPDIFYLFEDHEGTKILSQQLEVIRRKGEFKKRNPALSRNCIVDSI